MAEQKYDASLDLLRRLNPKLVQKNLSNILTLINDEELSQDLLLSVDIPLETIVCPDSGKKFLCCDYNRDADLYRSPWLNKYVVASLGKLALNDDSDDPPPFPSLKIRELEEKANDSFDIYRDLYYEGGFLSVYLWDTEDDETIESFAGVVLFQKKSDEGNGKWDSIHVFEVEAESSSTALYKVTSLVILDLLEQLLLLLGSLTRQLELLLSIQIGVPLETAHLINIGQLIEKSEYNLRNLLQDVYFDKLKDVITKDLRSNALESSDTAKQADIVKGLQEL